MDEAASASAAAPLVTGANESGHAKQDGAAAGLQSAEETAESAVRFSEPEIVSAADVSDPEVPHIAPASDGAPAEQAADGAEQQQADLREGDEFDEEADAEQAGGTCKQS